MSKNLYEEYFGGEIKDTNNLNGGILLNRWQYRVLSDLFSKSLDAITPESLSGRLLSKNYNPIVEEDRGTQNLNKKLPSHEEIRSFLADMLQRGFLGSNGKPLFDSQFKIRRHTTFPRLSGPRGLFMELTDKCGLDCITCYNEFARGTTNKALSVEQQIDILDQAASFGARSIALTGGETTMATKWFEIAQHAHRCGMVIRFYTCGIYPSRIRGKTLEDLIALSPNEIRITYAGMKDTNDCVRVRRSQQKGTFDEITQTVEELLKNGQHVKLNYIFSRENIDEIEPFLLFVYELSQKHSKDIPVNIGPLRAYGAAAKQLNFKFTSPTAEDFYKTNQLVSNLRKKLEMVVSVVFDCVDSLDKEVFERKTNQIKHTPWPFLTQGCGLARSGIGLGFDGTVNVCGIMGSQMLENVIAIISEKPKFYSQFGITVKALQSGALSNLRDYSVERIWYESPLLAFFQFFYRKEQCENCNKYRVQCMGICPAMALKDSADLRRGDLGCIRDLCNTSTI